jgi:DNA modification methylase
VVLVYVLKQIPLKARSEKNRGCEDLEDKKGNNNLMASKEVMRGHPEKGKPVWSENKEPLKVKNNHPTCKPIKLMSWLTTLASREGDIVLDPFCGSGTTPIAAKMLGRQYIGIDKEEEYCEIARKRISAIHQ